MLNSMSKRGNAEVRDHLPLQQGLRLLEVHLQEVWCQYETIVHYNKD